MAATGRCGIRHFRSFGKLDSACGTTWSTASRSRWLKPSSLARSARSFHLPMPRKVWHIKGLPCTSNNGSKRQLLLFDRRFPCDPIGRSTTTTWATRCRMQASRMRRWNVIGGQSKSTTLAWRHIKTLALCSSITAIWTKDCRICAERRSCNRRTSTGF